MRNNRRVTFFAITALVIASFAMTSPADAQRRASAQVGAECAGGIDALFDEIEPVDLDSSDEIALSYLREEEKLARDVYLTLADTWQLPIFANIAVAEQNHMDLVLRVFEIYGLDDPITDDTVGVFGNGFLAQLYIDLVAAGQVSLVEGLLVGATIEDMDLYDLYEMLENTDNDYVELVAYNLAKGSRNHLRAFVRALAAQDVTYAPQYLDQETFDAILAAEMERRMLYDADGEPVAACGGAIGGFGVRRGHGQGDGNGPHGDGSGEGNGTGTHGSGTGVCDGTGPNGGSGNGNGSGNGTGGGN